MQNFEVTNKEHYGTLWYFLEWSIANLSRLHCLAITKGDLSIKKPNQILKNDQKAWESC